MTYLEALKGKLNFPLSDNSFILALTDRGLTESATYAKCAAFDLAYADAIMTVITSPNVSEGGYSITLTERSNLLKLAEAMYAKHGQNTPVSKPSAKFVNRW